MSYIPIFWEDIFTLLFIKPAPDDIPNSYRDEDSFLAQPDQYLLSPDFLILVRQFLKSYIILRTHVAETTLPLSMWLY